ncbi:aromatic acid/H+ symport family MFS transporter [Amycolatopsis thermalba]|uniref:Aromatic acid/H+ symport family MFS transporter n=1 Tax=Amycolatopsis thermalba TaxID=944492 RepID=A0ABY4NZF0_9PSEU|nr:MULTISPECIES: aromatic acid/H+ symport family MFS transporter [Amycolatopsis]UQS25382.1 aromatic acid/H+ symport family MFS transporter [Amycolatopsis thermalba]
MTSLDLQHVIDRNKVGGLQRKVLLLCLGVVVLDGLDLAVVAYLGPPLLADWGLAKAQLGPVITSGLLGMALGSLVAGPIADRVGRRKVILASMVFFGVMCAATALAPDVVWFSILRLLTGFGLGAALPNATTLVSEYAPVRRRGTMMALTYCGHTLGGAIAGFLTSLVVQVASWHWALVAAGVLPIAYAVVVYFALPESPKYLARQAGREAELVGLVNRIVPENFPPGTRFALHEPPVEAKARVAGLVARRFRLGTATIWIGFSAAFFIVYLTNSWMPILMTDIGFSLTAAATMGLLLQAGGTLGNLGIGSAMDRFGLHRTVVAAMGCACAMFVLVAVAPPNVLVLGTLMFVMGVFTNTCGTAFPIIGAAFYPTSIRATGTSWATGVARFGAIGGAAIGTVLVAAGLDYHQVFLSLLVPGAVCILAVVVKGRRARAPEGEPVTGRLSAHS